MPIEFTLPEMDQSHLWRALPYEKRMAFIGELSRVWFEMA